MHTAVLELKDLLQVDSETKILSCFGQRVIVADVISRGLLRKELIQIFGTYGAKNVLTRYGYAHGWRTAEMLKTQNPALFNATNGGAYLHRLYGLVFTTSITESDSDENAPLISSKLKHSYEAEQHLLHLGKSQEAICWTLTGFASGYESFKRQKDVYFLERKCTGMGDDYCEIEGRYADQWGDILKDQLPFYGMASTNDILMELSNQLISTEEKLARTKHQLSTLENHAKTFHGMLVRSQAMQQIVNLGYRVAKNNMPIVIRGESGVGKELMARYIHRQSDSKNNTFLAVNCGAFSEELLESELFGHAKGSFTGADRDHKGLFEEAEGGTLFLDEIAETSLKMQVKLLRVLQEKEIRRVGESFSRKINVRVISASNKDLEQETEKGHFRQDLYYRVKVIELHIPPLRERVADILPLAHSFLQKARDEMSVNVTGFSSNAAEALLCYGWPGNIRELQNVVYRATALCESNKIVVADFPTELRGKYENVGRLNKVQTLADLEKEHIRYTISNNDGDKKAAASQLGIAVATLYRKIKSYNIKM